jgi:hypothetical protein
MRIMVQIGELNDESAVQMSQVAVIVPINIFV